MTGTERARLTLARIHLQQAEAELVDVFNDELGEVLAEAVTLLRETRHIDPEVTDDLKDIREHTLAVLRAAIERLEERLGKRKRPHKHPIDIPTGRHNR
jgi:hypothetical protein